MWEEYQVDGCWLIGNDTSFIRTICIDIIQPTNLQSTHYRLCIFMCLGLAPQIPRQMLALGQRVKDRFLYSVRMMVESHVL